MKEIKYKLDIDGQITPLFNLSFKSMVSIYQEKRSKLDYIGKFCELIWFFKFACLNRNMTLIIHNHNEPYVGLWFTCSGFLKKKKKPG